jgi:hypothetical protein
VKSKITDRADPAIGLVSVKMSVQLGPGEQFIKVNWRIEKPCNHNSSVCEQPRLPIGNDDD